MTTPVVAIFVAKPGAEEKLEELFRAVIPPTLAEEGCIHYQLNRDLAQPRRFVWTEEWESPALLKKHLASPHITDLLSRLPDCVESSEVIALGKIDGGPAAPMPSAWG